MGGGSPLVSNFIAGFVFTQWYCAIPWQVGDTCTSLAPGKFEWNFRFWIFQIISKIDGWGITCELAHRWMPLDLTDAKSTLAQVMVWCRQATSHYLSQCWPRSLSSYGITRPQWVKWTNLVSSTVVYCSVIPLVSWGQTSWERHHRAEPLTPVTWLPLRRSETQECRQWLTHWGSVMPCHYLNQCWNIVNLNLTVS